MRVLGCRECDHGSAVQPFWGPHSKYRLRVGAPLTIAFNPTYLTDPCRPFSWLIKKLTLIVNWVRRALRPYRFQRLRVVLPSPCCPVVRLRYGYPPVAYVKALA
jgi:hypothetical protein